MQGRVHVDSINKEDIVLTTGVDTFVTPGKMRKTLAIPEALRADFYADREELKELLLKNGFNPTIEEGVYVSQNERERKGEYSITFDGAEILLNVAIRQKYPKHNTDNLCIINDDLVSLSEMVNAWENSEDKDLKLQYVHNKHHITMYLRMVDDKPRCFILDTQPKREIRSVVNALRSAIPTLEITRSTTPLQLDFFSCPVFSLKAMKYYVKHGHEIFDHIDEHKTSWDEANQCYALDPYALPARLMKMIQARLNLMPRHTRVIISNKKDMTLGEYLDDNRIVLDKKPYNAAALIKRYKFLDLLSITLKRQATEKELSAHILIKSGQFNKLLEQIQNSKYIEDIHYHLTIEDSDKKHPFDYLDDNAINTNPEILNSIAKALRTRYTKYPSLFTDLKSKIHNSTFKYMLDRPKPKSSKLGIFRNNNNDKGDKRERKERRLFWYRTKKSPGIRHRF